MTKRLQAEGGNDEITLGFDEILGELADHLPEEEPLMMLLTETNKRQRESLPADCEGYTGLR